MAAEGLPAHELGLGRPQIVHNDLHLGRRLLRFLEQARIVHRVADISEESGRELEIRRAERPRRGRRGAGVFLLGEIDHADDAVAHAHGHADEGARAVLGVVDLGEARVLLDVVHDDGVAQLGDFTRHALPSRTSACVVDLAGQPSGTQQCAESSALLIEQHDRADVGVDGTHRALED